MSDCSHFRLMKPSEKKQNGTLLFLALALALMIPISAQAAGTDTRTSPTVVSGLPYNDIGSTVGATSVLASSACSDQDNIDHWYRFTPTTTGLYQISLCGSGFDTALTVYPQGSDTPIACNDDRCGYQSSLDVELTVGTGYDIRVSGYSGATGNYQIAIESLPAYACAPETPHTPYPANSSVSVKETVLAWNQPAAWIPKSADKIPKVIYGDDDRLDEYEVTDAGVKATGASTAMMLSTDQLTYNAGNDTYSLPSTPTFSELTINGFPICPNEPYLNQPRHTYCSGFLVASDIIATAGHCLNHSTVADTAFVFGYVMTEANTAALTYTSDQVYFGTELVGRELDDLTLEDWALVRLDRPVIGYKTLPVRRSGTIVDNTAIRVIGHPIGLPRKYAAGATVQDNSAVFYFTANLDTYQGNSGSAVFDANTHIVEGLVVRGVFDFTYDEAGTCYQSTACNDTIGAPGCEGEEVNRATTFSDLLPTFDVYFGTDPASLNIVCDDITTYSCDPGTLVSGTTYFWQVKASNSCGSGTTIDGPLWTYTTEPAIKGDINDDGLIDLKDTQEMLRILTAQTPTSTPNPTADVNQDSTLDNFESTYQLQQASELRAAP